MHVIDFPSGMRAEVRKIRGTELVTIAEQIGTGQASNIAGILDPCLEQTVDPGPYPHVVAGDAKPDWSRILKGDLLFGLIELRRLSFGEDGDLYSFPVQCENCLGRYEWDLNLRDVPVKRLPDESKKRLKEAGGIFEATIGGVSIRFKLQLPEQEEAILRLMKAQKRRKLSIVDQLASQTHSIDGVNPDLPARWKFIAGLDYGALMDLQEAMELHDCGMETEIQTRCTNPDCLWEQDIALPLGKSLFTRKRNKPASSASSSPASPSNGSGGIGTTSAGSSTEEAEAK